MMDVVSSEYGWPDEYILNMAHARVLQIANVIAERQKAEAKKTHSYAQLFYNLVALLRPWEGQPPRMGDLFDDSDSKTQTHVSQYRGDRWWQKAANN